MSKKRTCPNCHTTLPADAPAGVCPTCALRAGFDSVGETTFPNFDSLDAAEPTLTAPSPGSTPRPAEEIAHHLPELEGFALLGHGGMGAVYRARHRRLDRPVAVKVLDTALRDDAAFGERFTREARTLAQLDHPNIVRVYDFGHREGLFYLVMELVDGVNLRQTIQSGSLGPAEAMAMVPKICEALQYAHDQGVVHRDIKPENVLVDRKGTVKIADFGLAKLVGVESGNNLTQTQQIMGTPNYMAPEQIEHPAAVDHRADIFALGVVFYELLTGELPIGRFPPPSRKVEVDVRLDEVVLRTLEKEPRLRYQQARELQSDVESLSSGGQGVVASPPHPSATDGQRRDYEYRSSKTLFGLPWIHIAFSRDASGKRMRVANGVIAIGDMAIGGVAIGAFAFGGITFGGISLGLMSFGGLVLGLLTALGGFSVGGFATGGVAVGLFARGALEFGYWTPEGATLGRLTLLGWLVSSAAFTVGAWAAIHAWVKAVASRAAPTQQSENRSVTRRPTAR